MIIIVKNYVYEFIYIFIIATLGISAILGAFEMIGSIDALINWGASFLEIFLYWLYLIPKNIYYFIPMSVLGCIMYVFGRASRDLELVVIKSIGGSIKRLFTPLIFIGIIIALLNFLIGEFIAVPLKIKAHDLKYKIINKVERDLYKTSDIWQAENNQQDYSNGENSLNSLKCSQSIIHAKIYLPKEKRLLSISVYIVKDNILSDIIEADECKWNGSEWMLHNVKIYNLKDSSIKYLKELVFKDFPSPKIYDERSLQPDEMSFIDLYQYYKALRSAGYKNQGILVDLYSKISYPLTAAFTLLLGIAVSTSLKGALGRSGRLVGIGITVFMSLGYWFAYTLLLSLGYSDIVHPIIAAWTVPLCFGWISIYKYYKIPE